MDNKTTLNKYIPTRGEVLIIFTIGIFYFISHVITFLFAETESSIMTIWPAGGIGLAVLLIYQKRLWPSILLTLFVSGIIADIFVSHRAIFLSLELITGNVIGSLLYSWFILKLTPDFQRFTKLKEVLALLFSAIALNAITSCIVAGTVVMFSQSSFTAAWKLLFISEGLGIFLVTPLVILWIVDFKRTIALFSPKKLIEFFIAIIIWSSICYFSFNLTTFNGNILFHPDMLIALILWPSVRFRMQGVTLFVLILFILALFSKSIINGPMPWMIKNEVLSLRLQDLQIYLWVILIVGYITTTAFTALSITETELRESKSSLTITQRVGNIGSWLWDLKTNKLEWSTEMFKIFGVDESKFTGTLPDIIKKAIHPDDFQKVIDSNLEVMNRAKPVPLEYRIIRPDGSIRCVWAEATEIEIDNNGRAIKLRGILHDITERKNAEEEIIKKEKSTRNIIETALDGFWSIDLEGNIIAVNNSACKILNYSREEMLSMNVSEIEACESEEAIRIHIQKIYANGFDRFESKHKRKDGNIIDVELSITWNESQNALNAFIRDATLKNQTEKFLKESEERLIRATNAAQIGVWDWDIKNNRLIWDDSMYLLYGINKNDFKGIYDGWLACIHPDDKDRIAYEIKLALEGKKEYVSEFRIIWPDKTIKYIKADSKTFLDEKGEPIRMLGTNRDITERKNVENILKESEERFSNIFYTNPVAQSIISREGNILAVNEACCILFGYTSDELINRKPEELNIWTNEVDREKTLKEMTGQGYIRELEISIRTKKGTERRVLFSVEPLLWQGIPCTINSTVDITERKIMETMLRDREERFRLITSSISDISYSCMEDVNGGTYIDWVFGAVEKITGYTESELIAMKCWGNIVVRDDFPIFKKHIIEVPIGMTDNCQIRIRKKDGTLIWVYASSKCVKSDNDSFKGNLYGAIVDITERKKAEEELENYKRHLEELVEERTREIEAINKQLQESLAKEKDLSNLKSRFISTASHEFRTPLTSILMSTGLIQKYYKKWDQSKTEEHFERVIHSVKNLTKLIDDVIIINRADAGKLSLSPMKINLREICERNVDEIDNASLGKYNIKLNYDCPDRYYLLDPKQVDIIMQNLLSNAVKYSSEGSNVIINVNKDEHNIIIDIMDEGIGIPEEDLPRLSEPFHRARNAEEYQGSGLGLSIVRNAVELHKGEMKVTSKIGIGTTFSVKLPVLN